MIEKPTPSSPVSSASPAGGVREAEDAAIAALWTMLAPQRTETYEEFKKRDPIGWEEHEALGAAVARAVLAALNPAPGHGEDRS